MRLFTTITSERGKPVTKSGNEYIDIEVQNEHRTKIASIRITEGDITIHYDERLTDTFCIDSNQIE